MFKICTPHYNVAALRGTDNGSCHFHCTVLAALRGTDNGSCHFHCMVLAALHGTDNGSCHFHCMVPVALCDAGVCLCLFLALNVVYLRINAKLGLVVGMTKQMSNGNHVD